MGAASLLAGQAPLALRPDHPLGLQVVASPEQPQRVREGIHSDLDLLFLMLGGVSLLVGAIGIANVTLVSVIERVGEIGLRRALGASRRHIAIQFLLESATMGVVGGVLGASAGMLVVVGVATYQSWAPVVGPPGPAPGTGGGRAHRSGRRALPRPPGGAARTRRGVAGGDMKVLLVEDDEKIAAAVKRGLDAEGFAVEVALDGDEGLWHATEYRYDLVVLDLMLPLAERVPGLPPSCGPPWIWTPILVLTAKDGELDEAEALDTGADDYLTKPFSFPVLVAHIRALLAPDAGAARSAVEVGDLRLDPSRAPVLARRRGDRADRRASSPCWST